MPNLKGKHCVPCEGGVAPLAGPELLSYMGDVPLWKVSADGKSISREFVFTDFVGGVVFITDVAHIAEEEGHHPDLHLTDYRKVEVVVATHAGGQRVTMADLVLAAKLDALPADYSPKWLREQAAAAQGGGK